MRTAVLMGCESRDRFQAGFSEEALGERGQSPVGKIEFDALDAVHGEEHDCGRERFSVAHHDGEILERRQLGSAQAQALGSESQNHSPEFFARVAEVCNDKRSRSEGGAGGWRGRVLLHAKIVAGRAAHCKSMSGGCARFGKDRRLRYAGRNAWGTTLVIEFRNVSYRVNGVQVLTDLNLHVARGETLVLLGRSGSGKTTTLKLVNRLAAPSAGKVLVNGAPNDQVDVIELRRGIGYVIQETGLFPHFTVERNIGLVPKIEGWPQERIRGRVAELLQLVGLGSDLASRYPHQLSGGQRQRVGVARALAADPKILLMDEPFGALDPLTRDELQREFLLLQQRLNKTVVFVTHDLREALRLGSRIALMEAGKLVTVLTPQEFVKSSDRWASAYVRAFGDGLESAANRGTS